MDRPPVSKVMPLPTRTTRGRLASAPAGRVVEPDQPRRGGRGLADGEDAAEPLLRRAAARPRSSHARPHSLGEPPGLLGEPLRGLEVGGHGRQHPGAPAGAAQGRGRARRAAAWSSLVRPASTIRRTGSCSGPCERQWNANEPSIAPTTNAVRASASPAAGTVVATTSWSNRHARARAAPARRKSAGAPPPSPTSSTEPEVGCRAPGHRHGDHLAGLAGGRGASSSSASRSSAERVAGLGRAGRRGPVVVVATVHREREHLHPRQCVRGRAPLRAKAGGETWAGRVGGRSRARLSRRRP